MGRGASEDCGDGPEVSTKESNENASLVPLEPPGLGGRTVTVECMEGRTETHSNLDIFYDNSIYL